MGERYKMITKETKDVLAGKYGKTTKPVDPELQKIHFVKSVHSGSSRMRMY